MGVSKQVFVQFSGDKYEHITYNFNIKGTEKQLENTTT